MFPCRHELHVSTVLIGPLCQYDPDHARLAFLPPIVFLYTSLGSIFACFQRYEISLAASVAFLYYKDDERRRR